MADGFSAYGSLGFYAITGSVANPRLPDRFVIPENLPADRIVGTLPSLNPAANNALIRSRPETSATPSRSMVPGCCPSPTRRC